MSMSQDYTLEGHIQIALVAQLNAVVTKALRGHRDNEALKTIQTQQCDTVKAFIANIEQHLQNVPVRDEDSDLRLKILLQSKQILIESKYNTLQQLVKLMEESSVPVAAQTSTPKHNAKSSTVDENSVNFTSVKSAKDKSKKRKRTALAERSTADTKMKLKTGVTAPRYQGARVFAFEDSEENEESPSKRARVTDEPLKTDECTSDVLMTVLPINEELASDVDLFALDSEPEARQLMSSRECAVDVDLSKFNFERLEERSSQPEHISSQPGRSMDVKKKLQQIESYLSETSEPQESCEREELPTLLAYQLSQTDYAALVREEEESQSKSKEDD